MASSILLLATLLSVVSALPIPPSEVLYTPTPVGYVRSHCVHHVPSGSHISVDESSGQTRVSHPDGDFLIPECNTTADLPVLVAGNRAHSPATGALPADYDGWEAYTAFKDANATFDSFVGYFSVPDKPKRAAQVLYLFTGLQNIDWIPKVDPDPTQDFDIIQPVLQYPCSFLHREWCVKSWYVTVNAGAMASDPITVQPGDKIWGNMTRAGPQSWYVGSTLKSSGKTTEITADHPRLKAQPWAYCTLECYGCDGCDTYPNTPSAFTEMSLMAGSESVSPSWKVNPKPSQDMQCHEGCKVDSPSTLDIYFQEKEHN